MKTVHRSPVESSSIVSIGYDAQDQLLDIEFPSGEVYRYFGVPALEYENLMTAESKGKYLNLRFNEAGYRYELPLERADEKS